MVFLSFLAGAMQSGRNLPRSSRGNEAEAFGFTDPSAPSRRLLHSTASFRLGSGCRRPVGTLGHVSHQQIVDKAAADKEGVFPPAFDPKPKTLIHPNSGCIRREDIELDPAQGPFS